VVDPLAEVVALLQPGAPFSKSVSGAGVWRVSRSAAGRPFYCVILAGSCRIAVDGHEPITLVEGDFVLIPSSYVHTLSSLEPAAADTAPVASLQGGFRLGVQSGPPDVQMLVGHCVFGSPDAALLVSLLPKLVYVGGDKRLATLVQLLGDEARERRPARDAILTRLLEVLLIEALRATAGATDSPGLVSGLADERLALAIRRMHENPARPWTVAQLANEAALSRSAFFARFNRALGVAPIEYLISWRMALGKNLLRQRDIGVAEVAGRVGYSSASAFSAAFTRHVGVPPKFYAQAEIESQSMQASAPFHSVP
jgi:AraC-like DNA-binding protein